MKCAATCSAVHSSSQLYAWAMKLSVVCDSIHKQDVTNLSTKCLSAKVKNYHMVLISYIKLCYSIFGHGKLIFVMIVCFDSMVGTGVLWVGMMQRCGWRTCPMVPS